MKIKYWIYSFFLAIALYLIAGFLAGYPGLIFSICCILGAFLIIGLFGWTAKQ